MDPKKKDVYVPIYEGRPESPKDDDADYEAQRDERMEKGVI
jgi:hypothetical protein